MAKEEPQNAYTRWEKDFDLAPLELDLFYEYLEMSESAFVSCLFYGFLPRKSKSHELTANC